MGAHCIITGVPGQALLGEIEGMLLPEIQQRIIMIEVQGTTALVEFESERDADACVGECQLREATVQVERHEGGVLTPSRAPKRVKPDNKAEKEKRLNRVGLSYRFAPVPRHSAMINACDPHTWYLLHPLQVRPLRSAEKGPRVHRARGRGVDSRAAGGAGSKGWSHATLEGLEPGGAQRRSGVGGRQEGGARAPEPCSRIHAHASERLHVDRHSGSACTPVHPHHTTLSLSRDYLLTPLSLPHTGNGCRVRQGWDLGSDAIFKDMKSVITKSGKETKKGKDEAKKAAKAEEAAAKKEKAEPKAKGGKKGKAAAEAEAAPAEEEEAPKNGRSRRKTAGNAKSKDMPPPAVPGSDARSALYSEIDLAMYRPPSVITPEESDLEARTRSGITPGAITGGSANAISPGTMMYALLGTPTPQLPSCSGVAGSMLSPGTLNELGNMLQSPAPPTTSKRRRGADQGETSKASPS